MALPYYSKSDMSYYTNFSSQSYPFYWPTHSPSNNTTSGSIVFGSSVGGSTSGAINHGSHANTSHYEDAMLDLATKVISSDGTQKWILSIIGCLLVGLSGVFPLLLIPTTKSPKSIPNGALSTENSTAKTSKQESNIPVKPISNGINGVAQKVIANGHHKTNGVCKMNGNHKSEGPMKADMVKSSPGSSEHDVNKSGISQKTLRRLLSFAVGSLLGDVFLHLLPEAWEHAQSYCANDHDIMMKVGIWVLIGIVSFLGCEMLVANAGGDEDFEDAEEEESNNHSAVRRDSTSSNNNDSKTKMNGCNGHSNHAVKTENHLPVRKSQESQKQIAGYLNLVANCFDNFTHGLAVAGSFIVSPKIGIITTAAILLHEIPHEIGDFAILLRSGFNPWSAAKAQLSTALVGLLGAIFTLSCDSMIIGDFTWWILPFTSGCFIQISLSNILPDLMKEDDPIESCLHFILLLFGIGLMGFVTFIAGV